MPDSLSLKKHIQQELDRIADRTVPRRAWMGLGFLMILVGALLLWSFMGTLEMNIQGRGVVLGTHGLFSIQTPVQGIVQSLLVKPHDYVQKGSLVAEIHDAEKDMLLRTTQINIDHLSQEVHRLQAEIERETQASQLALQKRLDALQFDVNSLNEKLQFLQREHQKKLGLYQDGLVIRNVVREAERQISQTEMSLEEKKGEIADIRFQLNKSYRTEELKTRQLELLKAEEEAAVIRATLKQQKIYSPFDGNILEVLVNPGEVVKEGQSLFHAELASDPEHFLFYGFFPSELGKRVHPGSLMRMELSTVNQKEFGAILSRVKEVSDYAISEQAILNELHNANLAAYLSNHMLVTQVIAEPILDANDPSGLAWTSGKGPAMTLSTGIVGVTEATIERIHPIYYFIPLKKFKTDLSLNPGDES